VVWEQKKEERKETIHHGLVLLGGVIIFSIVTGIIGFLVGLFYDNDGSMGFLIGFLAPLIVLLFIDYFFSNWIIGDIPYNITGSAGNQDNFPLMKCPFSVQDGGGIPIELIILISVISGGVVIGVATLLLLIRKKKRIA